MAQVIGGGVAFRSGHLKTQQFTAGCKMPLPGNSELFSGMLGLARKGSAIGRLLALLNEPYHPYAPATQVFLDLPDWWKPPGE